LAGAQASRERIGCEGCGASWDDHDGDCAGYRRDLGATDVGNMVGVAVLSRYAVQFWNQGLHQGTSVPIATGGRTVADVFFYPLVICMVGFGLLFLALVLYRTGTEIRLRRASALRARAGGEL
jgi:Na+/H+-translocating membrane pyrophosphatase